MTGSAKSHDQRAIRLILENLSGVEQKGPSILSAKRWRGLSSGRADLRCGVFAARSAKNAVECESRAGNHFRRKRIRSICSSTYCSTWPSDFSSAARASDVCFIKSRYFFRALWGLLSARIPAARAFHPGIGSFFSGQPCLTPRVWSTGSPDKARRSSPLGAQRSKHRPRRIANSIRP